MPRGFEKAGSPIAEKCEVFFSEFYFLSGSSLKDTISNPLYLFRYEESRNEIYIVLKRGLRASKLGKSRFITRQIE